MKNKILSVLFLFFSINCFSYTGIMSGEKNLKINKTEYFDIIYSQDSVYTANLIFENADSIYCELAKKFNLKNRFRLPVVISANQDEHNAYFSTSPFNHIVVYDTVCSTSLAVFSDEVLNTFRHELIHAITYNLRNDFWAGFDKIFGDFYNPALLTVTMAFAEGAAVSVESDFGEGRINNEYSLQILKQAKIQGKFPKYSEIQGSLDIYPSGNVSYIFGGAFCSYLIQTYGMQKYADFWYRLVNFKSLTYFSCFKKVYGCSIKKAWKDFYDSIQIPENCSNPLENNWIKKVDFKNKPSLYSYLTSAGKKYFYYDNCKNTVNCVFNKKSKVLHKQSDVTALSVSKDERFLVESFSSSKYSVPKNKVQIFDLVKKSVWVVPEKSLRDATIVCLNGEYFLCAVKTSSAFSTLKIYKLELKNNKLCGITLYFEEEFLPNQQIFSLEGSCSGKLFYILKDSLDFSINQFDLITKETKNYSPSQKNLVLLGLNFYSSNDADEKTELLSFSYAKKGTMPRFGFIELNKNAKFKLCQNDISGGIYFPCILQKDKIVFVSNFFMDSKLYYGDFSSLSFNEFLINAKTVNDKKEVQHAKNNDFITNSKNFSALKYSFSGPRGTILPIGALSTYTNESLTSLKETLLPLGLTYVSSTPWTNPIWYVSVGYNLFTNSEGLKFFINGSSLTNLFNYSASTQIEFDKKGYKQVYGNLNLSGKLPLLYTTYLKLSNSSTILEGRQSETSFSNKKIETIYDYFGALKTSEKEYLYLKNKTSLSLGNISKDGIGYFDYSGVQLTCAVDFNRFSLADNFNRSLDFNNVSIDLLMKKKIILPITIETVLFPTESYSIAGMAKVILFNYEIQKSTNILPFFYANRFTLSSYYVAKIKDNVTSWGIKDLKTYFEHIKDGKTEYNDELNVSAAFSFTPNIGGLARNSFMFTVTGEAKYRFFPAQNQKCFSLSAGIGSNLSI